VRQHDLELDIALAMTQPTRLISFLMKNLAAVVGFQLRSGNYVKWPDMGTFYVGKMAARHRHDVHTNTIRQFPARNVPRMKYHGYQKQYLTSSWQPTYYDPITKAPYPYVFDGVPNWPETQLGLALSLRSAVDLNLCNKFLNVLLMQVLVNVAANKRVSIRNFGTFYKQHHAEKNGHTPPYGSIITVPAWDVANFRPSKWLRSMVN